MKHLLMETGESNQDTLSIVSPTYNASLHEQYHLSLQIGINQLSYCILDTSSLHYELLKSISFTANTIDEHCTIISDIINNNEQLLNNYSSYSATFIGFPSTLIPTTIYQKEHAKQLLTFNHEIFDCLMTDSLSKQDAKLVYSIPQKLKDSIDAFFPNIKIKSQSTLLIKELEQVPTDKKTIYCYSNSGKIELFVLYKGKLLLHNAFKYTTKEDVLYYVLFCMEQLQLSTEQCTLVLYGTIKKESDIYALLYEYIRTIEIGKRPVAFTYSEEFTALEPQQFFGLFSQVLCV